jgi:hypothetical protein
VVQTREEKKLEKTLLEMKTFLCILFAVGSLGSAALASLSLKVGDPKSNGGKVLVKLTITNTYSNAVESARAAVFLVDEKGKVVGQNTQWVIGGAKEKPALAPQASAVYYVTIATDKPFQKANVVFTRIVLEDGQVVQAGKGFEIEK